ncbi:MAG: TolC family protein [Magnetococcales bacterium]|nr:TolC family protein [Magnetococcales bacterium]
MFQFCRKFINPKKTLPTREYFAVVLTLLMLGGCTVKPEPLSLKDRNQQVFQDLATQFSRTTPPSKPITIDDAMAHALMFNLGHRVKTMDKVIALGMNNIASQKMLPIVAKSAGYSSQNRLSSESGQLKTTTSSLSISWNVLDLGISYISAQQQADRVLIAQELERKAAHNLMQEVRATFWRAIAAERLEKAIVPLKIKLDKALESSRQAEKEQIEPPTEALTYQVTLLETLQKLQRLQKQVSGAKTNLAELMGLDPGHPFKLLAHEAIEPINVAKLPNIEAMEGYALRNRPELWEKDYNRRIKALETKKTILRLFPGLDFSQSLEYDDTESYANNSWGEFGINVTWNLLSLLNAPDNIALAKNKERIQDISRLALNMSVLVQVHVALRNLIETREEYDISAKLSAAKEQLYIHAKAEQEADTSNELDVISRDSERILFVSQHDLAYAKLQNAAGAFLVSIGLDFLPKNINKLSYDELATIIKENNQLVTTGRIPGLVKKEKEKIAEPDNLKGNIKNSEDTDIDNPEWEIIDQYTPIQDTTKTSSKPVEPQEAKQQKSVIKTENAKLPLPNSNLDKPLNVVNLALLKEDFGPLKVDKQVDVKQIIKTTESDIKPEITVQDDNPIKAERILLAKEVAKAIEDAKLSKTKKSIITAKNIIYGDGYVVLSFIVDNNLHYRHFNLDSPLRFVIDFYNTQVEKAEYIKGFKNHIISNVKVGHPGKNTSRVVLNLKEPTKTESYLKSDESGSYLIYKLSKKASE